MLILILILNCELKVIINYFKDMCLPIDFTETFLFLKMSIPSNQNIPRELL